MCVRSFWTSPVPLYLFSLSSGRELIWHAAFQLVSQDVPKEMEEWAVEQHSPLELRQQIMQNKHHNHCAWLRTANLHLSAWSLQFTCIVKLELVLVRVLVWVCVHVCLHTCSCISSWQTSDTYSLILHNPPSNLLLTKCALQNSLSTCLQKQGLQIDNVQLQMGPLIKYFALEVSGWAV